MTRKLGDGPVEAQYVRQMNAVASTIDELFNGDDKGKDRKVGFILLVFPFSEAETTGQGRCNYISNAERDDVVKLLKDQIKRFENDQANKPA